VLIADYGLSEALLTVVSVFFFVIWIWILITILTDLFRDHEVSGLAKAAWVLFLVFVPFVTALVYLIVRGQGMRERSVRAQAEARSQLEGYIRDTAAGAPVEELARLHDLREKGAITEDEYERLKAKLIDGGSGAPQAT
jgi:ABC-type multidrug transport system fused ATPase/permease subunit